MKFCFLNGDVDEELNFNLRQLNPESCGLSGVIDYPNAAQLGVIIGSLQLSRGENGCGVATFHEGELYSEKRTGSLPIAFGGANFSEEDFKKKLPGDMAIVHNRYGTAGSADNGNTENVQNRIIRYSRFGKIAIGHNGTLLDYEKLRHELMHESHYSFESGADTEIIAKLILDSKAETFEEALIGALRKIKVAFSLLVMVENKIYAIKDRCGVRPLHYAPIGDGWIICSEDFPIKKLHQNGFSVRLDEAKSVNPAEIVVFEKGKKEPRIIQYDMPTPMGCRFEAPYFGHPFSSENRVPFYYFRRKCGEQVALENPLLRADMVADVPDSGVHGAMGLARALIVPHEKIFHRDHNNLAPLRTFTDPNATGRIKRVGWKLHLADDPRPSVIKEGDLDFISVAGKRVVVTDDSIVRGNTMRRITEMLRNAGAIEIIIAILFPPITNPCFLGMDFPTNEELLAFANSLEEIRRDVLNVDKLLYISNSGYGNLFQKYFGQKGCCVCTGEGNNPGCC
jgi:amidophosphoribosyltransferase